MPKNAQHVPQHGDEVVLAVENHDVLAGQRVDLLACPTGR